MPAASAVGSSTRYRARPAAAGHTGRPRSSVTSSECNGEERSTATVLTSSAAAGRGLSQTRRPSVQWLHERPQTALTVADAVLAVAVGLVDGLVGDHRALRRGVAEVGVDV